MAVAKTRSASRVLLIALTRKKPQGVPLGLVDNFSIDERHTSELIPGVGSSRPVENVHHGTNGVSVSWSQAHSIPEETLQAYGVLPEDRELEIHESVTLLVVDVERGRPMYEVVDVLPNNFSAAIPAMNHIRANASMTGRFLRKPSELEA